VVGRQSKLGDFEALEALSLGVLGKVKLWDALAQIAQQLPISELDFDELIKRAQTQHAEIG